MVTDVQLPVLTADLVATALKSDGVLRVMDVESLKKIEERYRRFLYLASKYPHQPLAPSHDIDEMWHLHMMNPRSYYHDCMNYLGGLMDHYGGFGRPEEERPTLNNVFESTMSLYEAEFGEKYFNELTVRTMRLLERVEQTLLGASPSAPAEAQAKVCLGTAEAQAKICLGAAEAQAKVCLGTPEAQAKICLGAPEAQAKICLGTPEPQAKICLGSATPQAKICLGVSAPQA
ncbi:glycine-rich domain-containing protein [Brevibacillus dissolubilis]|uniref:glycine-rich domain-containing protein n=1 Tax=Brevibacillus dissolubilis TaxID=1844116 RepID=UPI00111657A3|nr:glycine-rich domain-containing protein-like [Brevibacillus dissolubilis]